MSRAATVAAGVLLAALLALSGWQIAYDHGREPPFQLDDGTPIGRLHLDDPGAATQALHCRPWEGALRELDAMRWPAELPRCERGASGPFVVDRWAGGQLVWWPGERLEFQQW